MISNKDIRFYFIVFAASGFAGLIYESIWTHYLKLFLGHAAFAQALVLAVFMGGMALGSLLCSKYSERMSNALIGYALVEAVIGVFAVLFHPLFVQFLDTAYMKLIPALGSPTSVVVFKWTAATMLILPQSILLGATFPLMTAGLIRIFPQAPGSIVAMLYFTNSIGAVIGVLASGFLFIGWFGLPGTLDIAGFVNIMVAAAVWLKEKNRTAMVPEHQPTAQSRLPNNSHQNVHIILLLTALLTGLSSFIYEIGWIRMLSLVLGSSTHAFEIMLSAFIMGLAFGGLWIKRRIDTLQDPRRFVAQVQIAMGILALSTLPVYGSTFNVMSGLVWRLPMSELGYLFFNLASHSIALVIMLPASFCAGMTLPLITTALLRNGDGERSIGAVYGANTIGAILGVFIAVHLAMPLLGLKGTIILGASIDIAVGAGLAWWTYPTWRSPLVYTAVGAVALALPTLWLTLDPNKMASGVYRGGGLLTSSNNETVYYRDGKTATVSITKEKGTSLLTIRTNGKPDASIQVGGGASEDESTMVVFGALGIILQPEAKTAAIIGWGSGQSTHVLLTSPNLTSVDTIEIEPEMVRAARTFGTRVRLAYDDPRSHLIIDDAKSYFSFHNKKYDLILSEPSNPWVSGVSSLFSKEFYSRIPSYLNNGGLFIQWLQLYEIDDRLVASIMNALAPYFSDYAIYASNRTNIIIVACPTGRVGDIVPAFLSMKKLTDELHRMNISGLPDIHVRMLGNKTALSPFFASFPITTNSDYAPIVDLYAVRSRFFRTNAADLFYNPEFEQLPIIQMLGKQSAYPTADVITYSQHPNSRRAYLANMIYQYLTRGRWKWNHPEYPVHEDTRNKAFIAKQVLTRGCSEGMSAHEWWVAMYDTIARLLPGLSREQRIELFSYIESPSCVRSFSTPQRDFISLLKAVGDQDPLLMTRYADSLLKEMEVERTDIMKYILFAGILGNLSSDNVPAARLMWKNYGDAVIDKNSNSNAMRVLVAHMDK